MKRGGSEALANGIRYFIGLVALVLEFIFPCMLVGRDYLDFPPGLLRKNGESGMSLF